MIYCVILYHLYNFKNVKNTRGGVLLLVKLQASVYDFNKSNTSPWVFFTFVKLYKWCQMVQSVSYFVSPNSYSDEFRNLPSIKDGDFCAQKAPSFMFGWILIMPPSKSLCRWFFLDCTYQL